MSGASREEIAELLQAGESTVLAIPAMRRVVLQLFSKCTIVLTDRRVLLLAPVWPRGYGIQTECDRTTCAVLGTRSRIDGSTVVTLDFGDETISLFLAKKVTEEKDFLLAALKDSSEAEVETVAVALAEVEAEDFAEALDAFEEARGPEGIDEAEEALQELAGLSELATEEPSDSGGESPQRL